VDRAPRSGKGAGAMSGPSAILAVDGLTVSFGALIAVDAVSFAIERRRITSIIGPNGAGKSTLFNLVSGALRPSSGRVLLEGRNVTGLPPHRLRDAGLARSFQITSVFFDLTVFENLRLAAQALEGCGWSLLPPARSTRALDRVDNLLDRFALAHRADSLAGHLSHGEQRRLEIALALAAAPKLLLLDEPTQGMSHGDTAETAALIRELASEVTILLIEHDIGLVMDLSDHVVVMHQGQKLAEGIPAAIRADAAVRAAYLGRE
jgi:branched-chain amino acid transport system ATP-binding protein